MQAHIPSTFGCDATVYRGCCPRGAESVGRSLWWPDWEGRGRSAFRCPVLFCRMWRLLAGSLLLRVAAGCFSLRLTMTPSAADRHTPHAIRRCPRRSGLIALFGGLVYTHVAGGVAPRNRAQALSGASRRAGAGLLASRRRSGTGRVVGARSRLSLMWRAVLCVAQNMGWFSMSDLANRSAIAGRDGGTQRSTADARRHAAGGQRSGCRPRLTFLQP